MRVQGHHGVVSRQPASHSAPPHVRRLPRRSAQHTHTGLQMVCSLRFSQQHRHWAPSLPAHLYLCSQQA